MYSLFNHQSICRFWLLLGFFCALSTSINSHAVTIDKDGVSDFDRQYQSTLTRAYLELTNHPSLTLGKADITSLFNAANDAHKNNNPERVLGLINNNIALIKSNYQSKQVPELARLALKNYSLGTAVRIRTEIDAQAPRNIIAACEFEIANYLANQNLWAEALTHLKTIDIATELTSANADNAYVIWGAILQHSKKHRQALEYYQRVKPDSPRYAYAQLNIALVYIRQDWWTDAQIAMQNAIQISGDKNAELANKLYTTLGFSQLQQGFYRKARESFRNVKIKSQYADQALLGIGMSALNQEDYSGALNAFNQLKKQNQNTAPVEQSYLLSAVTHAKLKQNNSAANAYNEAVNYYDIKVKNLSGIAEQINSPEADNWQEIVSNLEKQNIAETPETSALVSQLGTLNKLLAYPISDAAKSDIKILYSQIFQLYKADAKQRVEIKLAELNSYLNQSRFGLTKLYDTP